MKKILVGGVVALLIGATSVSAASRFTNPAEIVANLTNKPVEAVIDEKYQSNKSYGMIAEEAGKYEEFRNEMKELKKDYVYKQLAEGSISQERADELIESIENSDCNEEIRMNNADNGCGRRNRRNRNYK